MVRNHRKTRPLIARRQPTAVAAGPCTFLRKPRARDEPDFLAALHRSRRLHHPWMCPPTDAAAYREYLRRCRRSDFVGLLLCEAENGALAGVFNLSQIFMGPLCSAYLGFYAFLPHAGRGLMREGMGLMLRHAFTDLGLHRLEANIQPGNAGSLKLVSACGFQQEGFSPRYLKIGGRWCDHERWAILADDWLPGLQTDGREAQ